MAAAGAFYPHRRGYMGGPAGDRLRLSQPECEPLQDELWEPEHGEGVRGQTGGGGSGFTSRSEERKQLMDGNV